MKRRAARHRPRSSAVYPAHPKSLGAKGTVVRSRQGSLHSPQFRGGEVIFGPVVRDHGFDLQKKVRQLGLRTALTAKQKEGKLVVLDKASMTEPRPARLPSYSRRSVGPRC